MTTMEQDDEGAAWGALTASSTASSTELLLPTVAGGATVVESGAHESRCVKKFSSSLGVQRRHRALVGGKVMLPTFPNVSERPSRAERARGTLTAPLASPKVFTGGNTTLHLKRLERQRASRRETDERARSSPEVQRDGGITTGPLFCSVQRGRNPQRLPGTADAFWRRFESDAPTFTEMGLSATAFTIAEVATPRGASLPAVVGKSPGTGSIPGDYGPLSAEELSFAAHNARFDAANDPTRAVASVPRLTAPTIETATIKVFVAKSSPSETRAALQTDDGMDCYGPMEHVAAFAIQRHWRDKLLWTRFLRFKILRWYRHCVNARRREVQYTEEKAALSVIKGHVIGYLRRSRRRARAKIAVAGRLGRFLRRAWLLRAARENTRQQDELVKAKAGAEIVLFVRACRRKFWRKRRRDTIRGEAAAVVQRAYRLHYFGTARSRMATRLAQLWRKFAERFFRKAARKLQRWLKKRHGKRQRARVRRAQRTVQRLWRGKFARFIVGRMRVHAAYRERDRSHKEAAYVAKRLRELEHQEEEHPGRKQHFFSLRHQRTPLQEAQSQAEARAAVARKFPSDIDGKLGALCWREAQAAVALYACDGAVSAPAAANAQRLTLRRVAALTRRRQPEEAAIFEGETRRLDARYAASKIAESVHGLLDDKQRKACSLSSGSLAVWREGVVEAAKFNVREAQIQRTRKEAVEFFRRHNGPKKSQTIVCEKCQAACFFQKKRLRKHHRCPEDVVRDDEELHYKPGEYEEPPPAPPEEKRPSFGDVVLDLYKQAHGGDTLPSFKLKCPQYTGPTRNLTSVF